jgi:dienelactone hydrolase
MSSALSAVKERGDWPATRQKIEAAIHSLLGKLPKDPIDPQAKIIEEQTLSGVVRRRVNYFVDEWSRITAWMFVPEDEQDCPAILCLHGRTAVGKDECAGIDSDPLYAFAKHYAEMGYVTFAPDAVTFGERLPARGMSMDTRLFYKDNPKLTALGKMLWDHTCCLDVLSEMKEVDPGRLGVIGHDLGAVNALMLAAFDDRIRTTVASSGFTRFDAEPGPDRWAPEEGLVLLPQLREAFETRSFPFDWEDVLALIAPNPLLVASATNDEVLAAPESVGDAVKTAGTVYKMLGASEALEHFAHNGGHAMTIESLETADAWFDRWL